MLTPQRKTLCTLKRTTEKKETEQSVRVSNHRRRSLLRWQLGVHSNAAAHTVRVDAREDIGDHHGTHDHHDGHNEVGHEGDEAKHQVSCGSPPTLDDLQECVSLHSRPG